MKRLPDPAGLPRRNRLATVIVERPRCAGCAGAVLHKHRSIRDQVDGSSLWWVACRKCGLRFRVVLE